MWCDERMIWQYKLLYGGNDMNCQASIIICSNLCDFTESVAEIKWENNRTIQTFVLEKWVINLVIIKGIMRFEITMRE